MKTLLLLITLFLSCGPTTSEYSESIITPDNITNEVFHITPQPLVQSSLPSMFEISSETGIQSSPNNNGLEQLIIDTINKYHQIQLKTNSKQIENIIQLNIDLSLEATLGHEGYNLSIDSLGITINSASSNGLFYGIQSLTQIIAQSETNDNTSLLLTGLYIEDTPRFSWRSFMLDEARYFHGIDEVKKLLDQMALLKMNVFHWHLTDDQGWRLPIEKYPLLTSVGGSRTDTQINGLGSKERSGVPHVGSYTKAEINELVLYAKERFIKIVPEIEMPGHASAAIAAYPWLGSTANEITVPVTFGVFENVYNVADPQVISFIEDVIDEVIDLFPYSDIIHIGGDEVVYSQWDLSEDITVLKQELGLETSADVQINFTNKISNYISGKGRRMMGWNDILGNNIHGWDSNETDTTETLSPESIVHFWKGDEALILDAVSEGYDVVNATHLYTYLNYPYDLISVEKAYNFSPIPTSVNAELAPKIIGIGCQIWGEWTPNKERG